MPGSELSEKGKVLTLVAAMTSLESSCFLKQTVVRVWFLELQPAGDSHVVPLG